ncbi:MAG: FkbM family methyltransferase [Acidobacteriia bacterium]|nr:FkbM family methyltransferase [Terriglobia bacterium]
MQRDNAEEMKLFRLPNGIRVWNTPQSGGETHFLHREIFVRRCYERNGVTVKDGDVVFDVGANIGMFSLSLMERFQGLRIYCWEPVPRTYSCLVRNLDDSPSRAKHQVVTFNLGAGKADEQTTIEFYPAVPGNSSIYATQKRRDFVSLLHDVRWRDFWRSNKLRALILAPVFPFRKKLLGSVFERAVSQGLSIPCDIRTLSRMIREYRVERIDLLKIDVEGAEIDVLTGIEDSDWALIRQISMEVDSSNKHQLPDLISRLRGLGFDHTTIENIFGGPSSPDDRLPCTLFAVRSR